MLLFQKISIHAPTKGATQWRSNRNEIFGFQSTLPRRERLTQEGVTFNNLHFNPRSHEGSDHTPNLPVFFDSISIHAPTKGATEVPDGLIMAMGFQSTLPRRERPVSTKFACSSIRFQSTLPRRERPSRLQYVPISFRFQSTLPRRERQDRIAYTANGYIISIHAPAKGATFIGSAYTPLFIFQSTLPRRERRGHRQQSIQTGHFNPRSREGSDKEWRFV